METRGSEHNCDVEHQRKNFLPPKDDGNKNQKKNEKTKSKTNIVVYQTHSFLTPQKIKRIV